MVHLGAVDYRRRTMFGSLHFALVAHRKYVRMFKENNQVVNPRRCWSDCSSNWWLERNEATNQNCERPPGCKISTSTHSLYGITLGTARIRRILRSTCGDVHISLSHHWLDTRPWRLVFPQPYLALSHLRPECNGRIEDGRTVASVWC